MRLNRYLALAVGISRRSADDYITGGRVVVDGQIAVIGQVIEESNVVSLDGKEVRAPESNLTIMLNKPAGIVVSRNGQGSKTIYDILPKDCVNLKPVGRLDKETSGLLLLTNDGEMANLLTHPSSKKYKIYEVEIDRALTYEDEKQINNGVKLEDGISTLETKIASSNRTNLIIKMSEGRNRQIRRTFASLNYQVVNLHRTQFASYKLGELKTGAYKVV